MSYQQPTESIGQSISVWDKFYQSHFEWTYKQALDICQNTLVAKTLTDKLFAKILLRNPEIIVSNDRLQIINELGLTFPYLGVMADPKKELSAGRLLNLYYQPN